MILCMVGIPTILSAMYGIAKRVEVNVRLYLYYLLFSFMVDLVYLVHVFMLQDPCPESASTSLSDAMADRFGEAFLCGVFRISSYLFVAGAVTLTAYCLWVIWTVCEDLHMGTLGPELHELLPGKDDIIQRAKGRHDGPYGGIVGFAHSKLPGPYPFVGTVQTVGMPGQRSMFGGK
eukprot:CAMPEP_0170603972 /NCGR_PEP_ID=MMETSP0224-20130122/19184_1 /TAXON_ID=285029 /ORGANISM="Togula jolla, Strain CCCM 725" /LENGTH=175 /DNA_ID=CAMNT_0010928863 /DNA_START=297 /DNA_END=824 /DNA_ORIENTATION=+